MSDKIEILKTLSDNKLIDIVKNFKQYGYDENIRTNAISILEEKGININDLKLTGNFENQKFNDANSYYNSFFKNSKIAFMFYCIIIALNLIEFSISEESTSILTLILITWWVSIILYFTFLIKSFLDHNEIYKLIGNEYKTSSTTMYYLFGAPFYFITYFIFKKQIYNEMKMIR